MIYQGKAVHIDWLEAGIAEFRFDLEGESVNKFNKLTLDDFAAAITALEAESDLQAVVVTSGKDGFIVGADITEFGSMFSLGEEGLREYLREANDAFNRFEDLKVPTVAAINGVALGGGFEMCLACDFRVMSEKAVVGLPEVKLGINPGFGGTVRLPRVIGVDNAVEWIATGNNKKPKNALKDGAVDAVVAADDLLAASVQLAKDAIDGKFDHLARREEKVSPVQLNDIERMMAFTTGKALVAQQAGPNMPAPITAVKMMEKGAALGREDALDVEAKGIMRLGQGPEAAALIGLFLNEQDLSARSRKIEKTADPVKRAGVLGAGIMGGGIAYQAAYQGTPMLMKDIAEAGLDLGMKEAGKLLAKRVDRGRMSGADMATALNRIRPTLDYTAFDQLDIVVEAVVENVKVKHAVLSECEKQIRDDAILTSNTSTISITKLAEALDRPENFCGMHFFNPVHRMPLVEVIRGEKTGEEAIARTVKFARQMGKTPVVVNDCPGFLVNRVLFPYFGGFNMLVADGVDFRHVDKVMERFGWPMGPGYLLDVVGMDTAYHAGAVMMEGFPDRMQFDDNNITSKMFLAERLGQKNGLGFYRYEEDRKGRPKKMEDETALKMCADVATQSIEISDEDIVARMMIPMCIESVRCLDENIVSSPADVDMGLVMGIGFPVFRGGALRYIDQMGAKAFCELADRFSDLGGLYQPTESLRRMAEQGERFFK